MLIGYPPFFSEDQSITCQKILHFKQTFKIPSDSKISNHAKDIIYKLVTSSDKRLGVNGVNEIKAHPFFAGINWEKIRY